MTFSLCKAENNYWQQITACTQAGNIASNSTWYGAQFSSIGNIARTHARWMIGQCSTTPQATKDKNIVLLSSERPLVPSGHQYVLYTYNIFCIYAETYNIKMDLVICNINSQIAKKSKNSTRTNERMHHNRLACNDRRRIDAKQQANAWIIVTIAIDQIYKKNRLANSGCKSATATLLTCHVRNATRKGR